jgi:GAF domain-containing protein
VQESPWRRLSDAELALHSELAFDAVVRTLLERATRLMDAQRGAVGVVDRTGVEFDHSVGDHELLGQNTDATDGTVLSAPIVIRDVPYARLVVADKRSGEAFTDEDGEWLSLLADHAAVAIENARRYESAIRWLAQLEALSEIGNALAGELDLPRLLAAVAERLRELLSASAAYVFLPTSDGDLEVRAAAGERSPLLVGSRLPRKGSKVGHVFDRGRSERVDMMIEDVEVYQPVARQMNARAGLFVPLLGDDRAMGVIAAVNKLGDDTFSEADLRLAETLAARVVVAVRLAAGAGKEADGTAREDHLEAESAGLTARETEVLRLVAYGMSDAQIAGKLVVSQRTVHSHLRSIYRKLHVGSRSEATRWAVERRLA